MKMLFLKPGVCAILVTSLSSSLALAEHRVTVTEVTPVLTNLTLELVADVSESSSDAVSSLGSRNYRLTIQVPLGTVFDLSRGSKVSVTLPTIQNRTAQAEVTDVSKTRINLALRNQVQLLDGQRLRVTLPTKPIHLYKIPFQAIYTPRGVTAEVFVVSPDNQVKLVPIVPLQVLPNGNVIISSDQLKDAKIVVHGTDNLLAGDSVQIVNQKEVQP
ncbi:hypothetical protein D3C87_1458000 [compost metagenome]